MLHGLSRRALALFVLISMLLAAVFCAFPWSMTRNAAAATASAAPAPRQRAARSPSKWDPLRRAFNQKGETQGEYFRINLPRSDLHVSIAGDALSPLEFTSYMGFTPDRTRAGRVMAMGEVVLRDDEVPSAV